jgi:uncharacterized protein
VDDEHRLGYLNEHPLSELSEDKTQEAFGESKKRDLTQECLNCPYLKLCNGACPKDRFGLSKEGEPGQYYLCEGLKQFFSHAVPLMVRVMAWTKEGMEEEQIMRRIRKYL